MGTGDPLSADEPTRPGPIASRRIHTGRVVNLDIETVRFPDGSTGEMEVFHHSGASAVVPVLSPAGTADPTILLIRQYRFVTGTSIWEVPAGRLDPGEDAEACARRELLEETGATAERFEPLTSVYTTPGFTDERIHLFAAHGVRVDETRSRREKDEFMEVAARPLSTILGMIRDGEIVDGKTIVAILYFAGFRAGL